MLHAVVQRRPDAPSLMTTGFESEHEAAVWASTTLPMGSWYCVDITQAHVVDEFN